MQVGWGGVGWGGVEWSGVQIHVPCLHQIESIQTQCRAQCVLYLLQAHIFGWVRLRTRVRSCVRMYVLCVCVCVCRIVRVRAGVCSTMIIR